MTTATYDAALRPQATLRRSRKLPLRALVVAGAAVLAIAGGAAWIAMPASSMSTDDAYVKADSTIIAPKVHGLIAEILVRDNQSVEAGQPLVRIDPEDYQQAESAAEADVAFAEAALAQQAAQQELASANIHAASAAIQSAEAEQVRAPTMTRLVTSLENTGLVRRVTDRADGRVQLVEATAAGRRLLDKGRARRVERLRGGIAHLGVEDQRVLARAAELMEGLRG